MFQTKRERENCTLSAVFCSELLLPLLLPEFVRAGPPITQAPAQNTTAPHPHQMIALKVNHGSKVAPFPDDQRKVSGQVTCRGTESDCAGAYRCHLTSWRLAQAVASLEPLLRSSAALPEVGEHRLSCAHGARAALVPPPREPPVALLRGVWRRLARHALSSRQPGPSNGATTNGNHTKMLSLQDDKHVIKRDTG